MIAMYNAKDDVEWMIKKEKPQSLSDLGKILKNLERIIEMEKVRYLADVEAALTDKFTEMRNGSE